MKKVRNYNVLLFGICIIIAGVIYTQMDYVDSAPTDIIHHDQISVVN